MHLDYLLAGVLGLVEGVTEFLPVSSTAHLHLVVRSFLPYYSATPDPIAFQKAIGSYCIILQGVAIAAMIPIFLPEIRMILKGIFSGDLEGRRLLLNLSLAFSPAACLAFLIGQERLACLEPFMSLGLLFGSIVLWVALKRSALFNKGSLLNLTPKAALAIGVLQAFALWPGVSRSLMGIAGGLFVGLAQKDAVRFSFLLGLMTLSAASGYSILKNHTILMGAFDFGPFIFGVMVTLFAAIFVARGCLRWLSGSGLMMFVYYRLILAVILLIQFC